VKARRLAWFEAQPELDPARLVFIDETGASTKMARLRGCFVWSDCVDDGLGVLRGILLLQELGRVPC
jgi:hypothetical protein